MDSMAQTPDASPPTATPPQPPTFREKLAAGRFVVSVEVDPPRGLVLPRRALAGAALLKEAGADAINIGDSPMARARMSPLAMAILLQQRVDVETILHYTTRDRNLIAIHSDMVGAHVLGVRNILCLRGDPPSLGGYTDVVAVWDINSVGLIRILKLLNDGIDWTGKATGHAASFFIGGSANPNAEPIEGEMKLMRRKVEAGAQFFMTQVTYDPDRLDRFLEQTAKFQVPLVVGIMPLHSSRHADFLHEQAPGIRVPEETRERMRRAGEAGLAEGMAVAREMLAVAKTRAKGVYLVPSFGRYELTAELVAEARP
jgi:5,10-methylenetetrahydrofolate reductase